jgi:GTP cyclohydrolase II
VTSPEEADRLRIVAEAALPTVHGPFRVIAFDGFPDGRDHIALVRGDVRGKRDVLVRIHSECLTGDVMGSLRCDCRAQLEAAIAAIARDGVGAVLYLRQEGRGLGLTNKIRAYALQDDGLDTLDANTALGFKDDERSYEVAAEMIRCLGIESVRLMTNNERKVEGVRAGGVTVVERVPVRTDPTPFNAGYLRAKKIRFGHDL